MNKIIDFIIQLVLILFMIFSFSNGVVYFIKNINKDDSCYLSFLLFLLIISSFFIIEQYKLLKKAFKNEE